MTPLELKVLIHYHVSAGSWFQPQSAAADDAADMFVKEGLLERADDESFYVTTERGVFYVRAILGLPFPVTTYAIPDQPTVRSSDNG